MNLSNKNIREKIQTVKGKWDLKKTLALAVTGAFIATGIAQLPATTAFAAVQQNGGFFAHHRDNSYYANADQILQDIQDRYGIEKKILLEYEAKGWRIHSLDRAAYIAYTAKVPFGDVLKAREQNKSWIEISESYGITREQYFNAGRDIRHAQLAKNLNLQEDVVKGLIADGYHPRDIAMGSMLAQKADKPLKTVLDHKKINNTWRDVATTLGLSQEIYESCFNDAQSCFGDFRQPRDGRGWHSPRHW